MSSDLHAPDPRSQLTLYVNKTLGWAQRSVWSLDSDHAPRYRRRRRANSPNACGPLRQMTLPAYCTQGRGAPRLAACDGGGT